RTLVAAFFPSLSVYLIVTFAPVRDAMSSRPTLFAPSHTRASATSNVQVAVVPFTVSVFAAASTDSTTPLAEWLFAGLGGFGVAAGFGADAGVAAPTPQHA